MRILVVDDDDTNRLVVRLLMETRGHQIIEADSGQAALDILSTEDFDLVFMDLSMPVMDGFETVRRIRNSTEGGRQVPILALSAHTTPEHRQRCTEVGMNGLIAKPLDVATLQATINLINFGDGTDRGQMTQPHQ